MKPSNELQKIDTYGDPVHERHVYLLKQKKTADDDERSVRNWLVYLLFWLITRRSVLHSKSVV